MLNKVAKVLEKPVCDHCLGRQFAKLLSGSTNEKRGEVLRSALAFALDAGLVETNVDLSNFKNFTFHNNLKQEEFSSHKFSCSVCDNFFFQNAQTTRLADNIAEKLEKYDFETFLIGTKPSKAMQKNEEGLWERSGIDFCEPIKSEINREIGKRVGFLLNKRPDLKNPDISVLIDLETNKTEITLNPLYIFGYYRKLVRGIPQSQWVHYKTSVEEIIAKPLMKITKAESHKFHGAGREDVDARCLAWRPFVIEFVDPRFRTVNFKKIEREVKNGREKQS